jgi:cytoskeletal protein RodZ
MDHETVINSISGNQTKPKDDKTKIIIIALAILAVVLAGAFIYIYAFGGQGTSDSTSGSSNNAAQSSSQADQSPQTNDEKTATSQSSSSSSSSSMKILGGSFSTGSAEEDKTYAQIFVGKENAGKDVIVQIFYSRDGNSLNHGNMVPASVHSDGYLYITSADAYHYYPDYATIKLYDSGSNLIDTQSVSLSPTSGTQTF